MSPRRVSSVPPPCEWVVSGSFPDGRLAADAPAVVIAATEVAQRLLRAVRDSSMSRSEVIEAAEVGRSTYYDLVGGKVFPDFLTLVKLSEVLGVSVWPTGAGAPGERASLPPSDLSWVLETQQRLEETRRRLNEMAERMRREL